ncbi:MAG: helix-turn-helix domain-containing protein [Acidobacteriota bacterium]
MPRRDHDSEPQPDAFVAACPSRDVLAHLGSKWTLLILVALEDEPVRFGALRRRVEGISQKMLTQSLRRLERDGLVTRQQFDEMPLRVEYRATALAQGVLPIAGQLKRWVEENFHEIEAQQHTFDREKGHRQASPT